MKKIFLLSAFCFLFFVTEAQTGTRCPVCPPSLNGVTNGSVLTDSSGKATWKSTTAGIKSGNGTTVNGDSIDLGGNLNKPTVIDGDGYSFGITNVSKVYFGVDFDNRSLFYSDNDTLKTNSALRTGIDGSGYTVLSVGNVTDSGIVETGTVRFTSNDNAYTTLKQPNGSSGGCDYILPLTCPNDGDVLASTSTGQWSWQALPTILSGSATLDFPNTAAGVSSDLTIIVTGAAVGDVVSVGVPNGSITSDNTSYWGWVSASNTVSVRFNNNNLIVAVNPASGTFKIKVFQ